MFRSRQIAVLDIGSKNITFAFCSRINTRMLSVDGEGTCSYYGYDDTNWYDGSEILNAVKSAIDKAEISSREKLKDNCYVYVNLPSMFSVAKCEDITLSWPKPHKVSIQDVNDMMHGANPFAKDMEKFVIEKSVCYYSLDEVKKVVEPVGMTVNSIVAHISVIAVERKVLEFFNRIFAEIGIANYRYINSTYAEAMNLFSPSQRDKRVIVADIGYLATTVAFLRGDGIEHMATFHMGGGFIPSDLSYCFDIDFDLAEALTEKIDLTDQVSINEKYRVVFDEKENFFLKNQTNDITATRIGEIGKYIKRIIDEEPFNYKNSNILYLTGEGISSIRGGKEIIGRVVGKMVMEVGPELPSYTKPMYSTLIGGINYAVSAEEGKFPYKKMH